MSSGYERTGAPNARRESSSSAPRAGITSAEARSAGYTGNMCEVCGSVRMRHTGHCATCEECGSTTGCS